MSKLQALLASKRGSFTSIEDLLLAISKAEGISMSEAATGLAVILAEPHAPQFKRIDQHTLELFALSNADYVEARSLVAHVARNGKFMEDPDDIPF